MAAALNIVFAGTSEFAAINLKYLIEHTEHSILAVYTPPDKPAGRGRKLNTSPVKQVAQSYNIPIKQPASLLSSDVVHKLQSYTADVMVVIAYGFKIPVSILKIYKYGCINLHASLLPKFRGASPIQAAILNGERETGVTSIRMDANIDTGKILQQLKCPIMVNDTAASLHDTLALLGQEVLSDTLQQIDTIVAIEQNNSNASYSGKILKQDAQIDWQQSAEDIALQIRAYNPSPISFSFCNQTRIRILQAEAIEHSAPDCYIAGSIISIDKTGIIVCCGGKLSSYLKITQLQFAGKKVMDAKTVFNAYQGFWGKDGICFQNTI